MIVRVLFLFLMLSALVALGILAVQKMTKKQFFKLTKIAGLAIISSSVAVMLMILLTRIF